MENSEKIIEKNLHEQFTEYGKNAREWMRKCAILLPEIERREIWRKKGFGSIYEYAAKLAGMSCSSVDDALRILKKVENKPELKLIIEKKGINAVRPVVAIATIETSEFWAEKVNEMSKNTLETYVREFKKTDLQAKINGNFRTSTASIHFQELFSEINLQVKPEIAEKLQKLKGQGSWNELMEKFIKLYEEKLEAEKPLPQKNAKRHVPTAIKQHALAKTNSTCAFPGCLKPYEILHHTDRFALTHTHDPDKLVPLCRAHEQLAHHGLIQNEDQAPENWKIRRNADTADLKHLIDQKIVKFKRPRSE